MRLARFDRSLKRPVRWKALDEARRRGSESDVSYAVLTSSYARNTSTGNWRFSDSVLAGVRGEGQVDLNGDAAVDLQEVARYAELELAFVEGQKSMFHAAKDFPRRAVLAEVAAAAEPGVGQRLEVEWKGAGRWMTSGAWRRLCAGGTGCTACGMTGNDETSDEWVGPGRVRRRGE